MKTKLLLSTVISAALLAGAALAQAGNMGLTPMPAHKDPNAIALYPGVAPGSEGAKQVEAWMSAPGDIVVRNVTHPTITPYLPAKGKGNGAAVVVAPGGGFVVLSMKREGYDVAEYLQAHGVAAFVLKYRVNETPANMAAMARAAPAPGAGGGPPPAMPPGGGDRAALSVADGQEAMRWVRRHAKEYGIDPNRVGMMGFSAGGGNVMGVTLKNEPASRPNFIAPIYAGFGHVAVPKEAPPMFSARAADDNLMGKSGFAVIQDWQDAGIPVEFHMYEKGGHGFGHSHKGTTSDLLMDQFYAWMKSRGLLGAASSSK